MTTKLTEDQMMDLLTLLRHRDIVSMIDEVKRADARTESHRLWREQQAELKAREVVITDDAAPAPGSIYLKMGEQDLLKAISALKDDAVATGDYTRVQVAESVLNERRLERQREALKAMV